MLSIVSGIIQESDNNGVYHPLIGPMGPAGLQGPTGPAGAAGASGPPGPQGVQGLQGPTGPTGATGPKGTAGPAGAAGAPGSAGATGAIGPQGPAGVTGPTGEGVPAGGEAGAKLVKSSSVDFATEWVNTFLNVQGQASAVTTAVGSDVVLYRYTLPASTMTANSVLRIHLSYRHCTGTAGITYKLKIGSAVIPLASNASGKTQAYNEVLVANLGTPNSQTYFRGPSLHPGGTPMAGLTGTFNVNTAVDEMIQLTAYAASSNTDQVVPGFFAVELQ